MLLLQEPLQPLDGEGLHTGDDCVEAVHTVQHEGALGAGKLSSAIPGQLPPHSIREQHVQVEFGSRMEDPFSLVATELPSTNTTHLLHLEIKHYTVL